MGLKENIRIIRLEKNMTLEELAKEVGTSKQTIHRYETGIISNVPSDKIEKIAEALGVTPSFLMGWESNIQFIPTNKEDYIMLPVLNRVTAGSIYYAAENIEHYEPALKSWLSSDKQYIYVKVKGDSMLPKFQPDDMLLIECCSKVDSGSYAVVLVDGEDGVVKKVNYGPGWLELVSENPYYPPRRFEGGDVNRVRILGQVKKTIRNE